MEQRLIDANELHGIETLLATSAKTTESKVLMGQILFDIESMPTIDPLHALGACYCRECKKFYPDADFCGQHQSAMKPTDFCSYGEREQNEILD